MSDSIVGIRAHTPGPWFVSGTRFKMNGGEWHSVNRYDETKKRDENIACVGFDPRDGAGLLDARLIAAAPDLLSVVKQFVAHYPVGINPFVDAAYRKGLEALSRATIAKVEGQ